MSEDDLTADMASVLGMDDEPDYEAEPPPLPDVHQVDRSLRRLAAIEREERQTQLVFGGEIDRLTARKAELMARLVRRKQWHEHQLAAWHDTVLAEDPKRKTIQLPAGTLSAKDQPPQWVYEDEGLFIQWGFEDGRGMVRTTYAPNKAEVKRHLVAKDGKAIDPETGVIVPGLVVIEQPRWHQAKPNVED